MEIDLVEVPAGQVAQEIRTLEEVPVEELRHPDDPVVILRRCLLPVQVELRLLKHPHPECRQ